MCNLIAAAAFAQMSRSIELIGRFRLIHLEAYADLECTKLPRWCEAQKQWMVLCTRALRYLKSQERQFARLTRSTIKDILCKWKKFIMRRVWITCRLSVWWYYTRKSWRAHMRTFFTYCRVAIYHRRASQFMISQAPISSSQAPEHMVNVSQ